MRYDLEVLISSTNVVSLQNGITDRQCLEVRTGSHFQFPGDLDNVIILSGLLYLSTSCPNFHFMVCIKFIIAL